MILRVVLLTCVLLSAATSVANAQVFQVDQCCACLGGPGLNTNIGLHSPIGQEFVPGFSVVSCAEFWVSDANTGDGLGAELAVSIHVGSITGESLGMSEATYVPDLFAGVTRFYFGEYLPLVPGELYVIQLHHVGGGGFMMRALYSEAGDRYPAGRFISSGEPVEQLDACFCEGRCWVTAVAPRSWTSIKALYGR